jgi:hypothetical protein
LGYDRLLLPLDALEAVVAHLGPAEPGEGEAGPARGEADDASV